MNLQSDLPNRQTQEWLETDGQGGFASGTAGGIRTRRYHALLLTATTPPTGRIVLVNGFEAWIETPQGSFAISSQCYAPDVVHPDGVNRIENFSPDPWPTWRFRFEDGTVLTQEIFVARESLVTAVRWKLEGARKNVRLFVRPLISDRDYHALHHENPDFRFDVDPPSSLPHGGGDESAADTYGPADGLSSRVRRMPERRSPSWKTDVASGGMLPATAPPTSRRWATAMA